MDWWSLLLAAAAGLGLGWLMVRNNNTDLSKIHIIDVEDFKKNMRKGQLVDIRKKDEYDQDKIKGARNFKTNQLTGKYSKLRKDQSVYLYCGNGKKSKRVAKKFARDTFTDVYVLKGGFEAYKAN